MAKGIGIVLNQLASMSKTLMGIGGEMQKLGSVASKIGDALGKAFEFAREKAVDAFKFIKNAFEPLLKTMRSLWDDIVMPIWNLMKEGMMFWLNLFSGEWSKALENAKTIWDSTFGKLWDGLKAGVSMAFDGLISLWNTVTGTMSKIFDATIGRAFEGLKNAATSVFDTIKSAWDTVTEVMQSVYDKTLGKVFDAIGGALRGVYNFGKSIVGGVKDLLPGGGGGGSTTNVGTAVSGGATYNFEMTFNLGGITDATDKRELAREIGDLIQQEISRSSGGGRARGRYT